MKQRLLTSGFGLFCKGSPSESGGGPPHSKPQAPGSGAWIIRQVLECAAPAALCLVPPIGSPV